MVLYNYYYDRVDNWPHVLNLLRNSLFAEEMVCSMSSELFHIPETANLTGNREMHGHLVPASYHRITAVGSAQRLVNGENRPTIIQTMTECILNAEIQDRGVSEGLNVMLVNVSTQYQTFINVIIRWQRQAESYLNQAKTALQSMGIQFPTESSQ